MWFNFSGNFERYLLRIGLSGFFQAIYGHVDSFSDNDQSIQMVRSAKMVVAMLSFSVFPEKI